MFAARTGILRHAQDSAEIEDDGGDGWFQIGESVVHGPAGVQATTSVARSRRRIVRPVRAEVYWRVSQCQCEGIESVFDQRLVATQLERLRRKGALRTTRFLIEALQARDVRDKTLLDIGGGIGVVHHELLASGAKEATDVDASSAYVHAAKSEAERRGLVDRARYVYGNFLDLAGGLPAADIVTLDRVICCFDDMQGLVSASAEKARHLYGIVYPRDAWWTKLGIRLMNFTRRIRGDKFRVFAHGTEAVESVLRSQGLARAYHREAGLWQVAVFTRNGAPT